MTIKRFAVALVFLLCAMTAAFAQGGPTQRKITFTVDSPFELKKSGVVLPPGHYVLFRFEPNNRHVFALYRDDMTHPPIAMIQTIPIIYNLGRLPGKTRMLMEPDESTSQTTPVLAGWNVPGEDGFEVIRTVNGGDALRAIAVSRGRK